MEKDRNISPLSASFWHPLCKVLTNGRKAKTELHPLEILHTRFQCCFQLLCWPLRPFCGIIFSPFHTHISAHLTPHVSILGQQQTPSWFCWVSKTNENFSAFSGKWIPPLPAPRSGCERMHWAHTRVKDTDCCKLSIVCQCCAQSSQCVCLTQEVVWSWISHLHKNAKRGSVRKISLKNKRGWPVSLRVRSG